MLLPEHCSQVRGFSSNDNDVEAQHCGGTKGPVGSRATGGWRGRRWDPQGQRDKDTGRVGGVLGRGDTPLGRWVWEEAHRRPYLLSAMEGPGLTQGEATGG